MDPEITDQFESQFSNARWPAKMGFIELNVRTGDCLVSRGACALLGFPETGAHVHWDDILETVFVEDRAWMSEWYYALKDHQTHAVTFRVGEQSQDRRELHLCLQTSFPGEDEYLVGMLQARVEGDEDEELISDESRQIYECLQDGVMVVNSFGLVTFLNDAAKEHVGCEPSEVLGAPIGKWIGVSCPDGVGDAYQAFSVNSLVRSVSSESASGVRLIQKDGSSVAIACTTVPICRWKRVVGHVMIFRKMAPETRGEQYVQHIVSQLNQAEHLAHVGTWKFDLERGDGEWSQETYRIFGLPMNGSHIRLERIASYVIPQDRARVLSAFHSVRDGQMYDVTYRIVRPTGEQRVVRSHGEPMWTDGQITGIFGVVQDITEMETAKMQLHTSEELLRQTEKLAVVGQLAAGLAHEIRNPLTALSGFTQLFAETRLGKEQKYIKIMQGELRRIEGIVNQLLVLAKPHLDSQREFNLSIIVDEVTELLSGQAALQNVQIMKESVQSLGDMYGDPAQLQQVCLNLLKNAIESMSKGGIVRILMMSSPGEIILTIADQGEGIAPDLIARLGEPFFTTKDHGTGLGLLISKRIVENHSGHIVIDSILGQGTQVTVTLPRYSQSPSQD